MEENRTNNPEMRKQTRVGIIIALSAVLLFGGMYLISCMGRGDKLDMTTTAPSISLTTPNPPSTGGEVIDPVYDPLAENLIKPFNVDATVSRYFYDMSDDEETRSNAIVEVPGKTNTYTKSVGVDYTYSSDFNIIAVSSGIVVSKSNDLIYGNIVVIEHPSGVRFSYSSLDEIKVNKGDEVKQGDVIGTSGTSTYTNGLGECLHFEITKDGKYLNPEKLYNQLIKSL